MVAVGGRRRVLIVVQNLPVPLDRRVWLECQALTRQGFAVSVICPKGPGDPAYQFLNGVAIHKYSPAPQAEGLPGYALEFGYSWFRTALLSVKVWRTQGFDVIQACNPPDTYWLLARLWKIFYGVYFVFDQHDLNPELFLSRFGEPRSILQRWQLRTLRWLEKMTYQTADHVISTNDSYRAVAQERGGLPVQQITVVRSGPDTSVMRPVYPDPSIRAGADHVLAYLGVMGPQDGVENVLAVMDELVHRRGRTGLRAVLMGFGDRLDALRRECADLGLDGYIRFTGRVGPAEIAHYLSAADVGLCPDLDTPLNNLSTMNKTMEYMAYGLPPVGFDLHETRVSAGDTGVFVPSGNIAAFADAIESLLDDADHRSTLGLAARRRAERDLDWRPQARAYVEVFHRLLGHSFHDNQISVRPNEDSDIGRVDQLSTVDLSDEHELRRFLRDRTHRPNPSRR